MTNDNHFKNNVKRWNAICPAGASIVENTSCSHVSFCVARSGVRNLQRTDGVSVTYLHSQEDPEAEAKKWFSSLFLKNIDVIYIYGVGLGYYYDAALDWLKESENRSLVFFEDDPEVIHRLFETERGASLLKDHQVFLSLLEDQNSLVKTLNTVTARYLSQAFTITALKSYEGKFLELRASIGFFANLNQFAYREFEDYGCTITKNFFLNSFELPQARDSTNLLGKFKNVPAIICGAGPSLDKNIDVLSTLGDRALIFAGGTALNALNARNVMPHFGVGIDPNPAQFTRLVMNHAYELPFFYRSRMLNKALQMVHGERLYVKGMPGYGAAKWMEQQLGFKDSPEIDEGFNVLNFSLVLAYEMGCNPIICVGIDLAYSGGASYASGIISHPLHDRKEDFKTKRNHEDLLIKNDINGEPVNTLWKWIGESTWYGTFVHNHPDVTVINATEGGIGFPNIKNMKLKDVRDQYLKTQFDMATRLHGEIQNSALPPNVIHEAVFAQVEQLEQNLKTCIDHFRNIIELLVDKHSKLGLKVATKDIDGKINEINEKLQSEEAYRALLEKFNILNKRKEEVSLERLNIKEEALVEHELAQKRLAIEIKRHEKLLKAAHYQLELTRRILADRREVQVRMEKMQKADPFKDLRKQYPLPQLHDDAICELTKQSVAFKDPEIGIDLIEKLTKPLEKINEQYSGGNKKIEQYFKEGKLHGPSTFYHENGNILAKAWFWNGKQLGKMWTYYPNGVLHSLQRFVDGSWEGKQQFYYPNGWIRSDFSYKQKKLHGDVVLFHSSGALARILHFIEGKRHGLEQIFDECGTLRIEANYFKNRPVGISREWNQEGNLIHEVIYDSQSNRLETRYWDNAGNILKTIGITEDYFDKVNNQMTVLTESLNDVVKGMTTTLPMLSENLSSSGGEGGNKEPSLYAAEFAQLQKEMEHLQSLSELIAKHEEGDEENPKEDIWKTPQAKNAVDQRLNLMGKLVSEDLKHIEKDLNDALLKLAANLERKNEKKD